ncbi:MAG: glycosyltransferase family 2 protein, partial [Telluria sp.]
MAFRFYRTPYPEENGYRMKNDAPLKLRARAPARKAATRWHGAVEGMHRGLVYGWAVDTMNPEARVVLEVCRNGDVIGTVMADVARTDLAEAFAAAIGKPPTDACHGFMADLGPGADREDAVLTVRIANSESVLDGSISIKSAIAPPVSATSNVFGDGSLRLHGWAFDSTNEKRALTIRAFIGHEQVSETVADREHPALRSYTVGKHGFTLDLPLSLADGQVHSVRVVDGEGVALNGSPLTVCCYAAGAKALLQDESNALLDDIVESYERYLPRSLGMEQYPQWAAMFEAPAVGHASPLKVGLIVTGDAGDDALAATTASINAQLGARVELFTHRAKGKAKARTFAALLKAALDAGCDVIGCVRAGDTIAPHALAAALEGFADPAAKVVYTDSEHAGTPWFKPAWNPDYALASGYPLELMLVRRALAENQSMEDDQSTFAWRSLGAVWAAGTNAVVHVPRVLYRFNTALTAGELQARADAAQQMLQSAEPAASLAPLPTHAPETMFHPLRVQRALTKRERSKTVSLVIPTRDRIELLERCISTIQQFTDWPNLEIIVIDNGSTEAKTKAYFRKIAKQGVTVLPMPGPFNFAELNNKAIAAASGEIVGMINNDIEALHDGWLDEIIGQLLRPGVGAVGAKLLWPNGMVQHGGVLMGVGNVAGHFGNRLADADWGDHGRNQLVQQVSGVTAACLFLRKKDYLAVGGMDPVAFPVAFNDVDLCLKLRAAGKAITWTPHAKLLHAESASRGHEDTPQKRARS